MWDGTLRTNVFSMENAVEVSIEPEMKSKILIIQKAAEITTQAKNSIYIKLLWPS